MKQTAPELRWGVERRLEFIEFRLYWEGGINRADITEYFGVSVPQASKDLSQYQELAPGNMEYDKSGKRYFATAKFKPRFLNPDPDRYLSQLRSIAEHISAPQETWLSAVPPLDSMPIPHRHVEPAVLRTILAAVRGRHAVKVLYQSMNPKHPDPMWRGISPHAFGNDGLRWHVRAFCHEENKFKDFLLSRCIDSRLDGEAHAAASDDSEWNGFFEVKLKPNPKLSQAQQRVIAEDFDMDNNENKLLVRKALLYYFEKRFRLDVGDVLDRPQELPVIIANRTAFEKALAETRS